MSRPTSPDFDQRVADWLGDDPDHAPAAALATVLAALPAIHQRPNPSPWWRHLLAGYLPIATATAIVLVAAAVGLSPLLQPGASSGDGQLQAARGTIPLGATWLSDNRVAFTASVPAGFQLERWRAATYDAYEGGGWIQTQGDITSVPEAAGQPLLDGTAEQVDPSLTTTATVTVNPAGYAENLLLAPGAPVSIDRPANVLLVGKGGWFAGVELADGLGGPYQVTAAALKVDTGDPTTSVGITQDKLRAAGGRYPQDVVATYTDVPDGAIGPYARQLLDTIVALSPAEDPYDLAATMLAYLRSPANGFVYDTDLSDVACGTAGTVECFAQFKRGYCLHFASTMAILLRDAIPGHPIPTRLVQGFLPGTLNGTTDTVQIKDAHAWVEVYFPNYGWIPFDPTANVGQPTVLPAP